MGGVGVAHGRAHSVTCPEHTRRPLGGKIAVDDVTRRGEVVRAARVLVILASRGQVVRPQRAAVSGYCCFDVVARTWGRSRFAAGEKFVYRRVDRSSGPGLTDSKYTSGGSRSFVLGGTEKTLYAAGSPTDAVTTNQKGRVGT